MRPLKDNPRAAVYRHLDASGQTLYIGYSINPMQRFGVHRSQSSWIEQVVRIDIQWFDTIEEAHAEERHLIAAEDPPFNRQIGTNKNNRRLSNGPATLRLWLDENRVSYADFDKMIGANRGATKALLQPRANPQAARRDRICVATEGLVPSGIWCAWRGLPEGLADPETAAKELKASRDRLARKARP